MKNLIFFFFMYCSMMIIGCANKGESQDSRKTYLDDIIRFHLQEVEKNKYTFEDYLEMTKPYGVWDIRPRNVKGVSVDGMIAKPGEVAHFHYGIFCAHFSISKEDMYKPIDDFLERAHYKEVICKESALRYKNQLTSLARKIEDSNHNIFISHSKCQRVDGLYFENGKYWEYDIPQGSPYVISNKLIYLKEATFSKEDKAILEEIKELGMYGAIQQKDAVIIIIDGLLDYSYGYILSPSAPEPLLSGPLFNIQVLGNIGNTDIYFYLSD